MSFKTFFQSDPPKDAGEMEFKMETDRITFQVEETIDVIQLIAMNLGFFRDGNGHTLVLENENGEWEIVGERGTYEP